MKLYAKIGHLPGSRTGPSDRTVAAEVAARCTVAARPGDRVVVQEKLDGSCVVVSREAGALVAYGREGRRCAESRNDGRRAFATWLDEHAATFAVVGDGEHLIGEWLIEAHGTRYALPHAPFVALDLVTAAGRRVSFDELAARLAGTGVALPHVVHDGAALPVAEADARLGRHGFHGALDEAEGLVYRVETGGRIAVVAKHVRASKVAGCFLADHTGGARVFNAWPGPWRVAG